MKLIGLARLGNDVEVRYTPNNDPASNLSLAFNYGRKDENGNKPTQWVDASLWGERAEKLNEWLTKGRQLFVICEDVHIEQYEGRNGVGHKLVGRIATLEFAGSNEQQGQGQGQQAQQQRQPAQQRGQAQGQQRQGSYGAEKGRSEPRQQTRQAQQQSGAANLADMDDDIPF